MRMAPRKRGIWLAGLCLSLAALAGFIHWIGDAGGALRLGDPAPGPASGPSGHPGFPLAIADAFGYEVILTSAPRTIASHSLATDHLLFGVVPHSRIVGVSAYAGEAGYSNIAERVRELDLPVVRDPETVLTLRPDLLFSSHIADPEYLRLVRAGGQTTFAMHTVYATLNEVADALRLTGALTGEPQRASRAAAAFEAAVEHAQRRAAPARPGQRVLGYSSHSMAYGAGSLFEDIVTTLGAVNVGTEQGAGAWRTIGPEQIASWNPDWIVMGTGGRPLAEARAAMAADPAVALTSAGRRGQLVAVEDRHFLAMSQHVLGLVDAIANALADSAPPAPGPKANSQ